MQLDLYVMKEHIFEADRFSFSAENIMILEPASISVGTRMEDALFLMETRKITSLLVTNGKSIVGVLKK